MSFPRGYKNFSHGSLTNTEVVITSLTLLPASNLQLFKWWALSTLHPTYFGLYIFNKLTCHSKCVNKPSAKLSLLLPRGVIAGLSLYKQLHLGMDSNFSIIKCIWYYLGPVNSGFMWLFVCFKQVNCSQDGIQTHVNPIIKCFIIVMPNHSATWLFKKSLRGLHGVKTSGSSVNVFHILLWVISGIFSMPFPNLRPFYAWVTLKYVRVIFQSLLDIPVTPPSSFGSYPTAS